MIVTSQSLRIDRSRKPRNEAEEEKLRLKKLAKKVKAEKKGAMRELRKDTYAIQIEKLRKQQEEDRLRKEKMEQIQSALAREQQEFSG